MGEDVVPESNDGNGTHFRQHVVEPGPVQKCGNANIEEETDTVDEEELQELLPVPPLAVTEREVLIREEDDHERHTRGADVPHVRGKPKNLHEKEQEREIHGSAESSACGKTESLGEVLTKKWMMP